MERIVILDSENGKVYVRQVPESMLEDDGDLILQHFADKENFRSGECDFMIVNDDDYLDDTTV